MPIKASTVYTKEKILGLSNHVTKNGKGWIAVLISNIVVAANSISSYFSGILYTEDLYIIGFMLFLDFIWFFIEIILPRVTLKKSPVLDAAVEFTFDENEFIVESQTKNEKATSTCNYSVIKRVENNKNDVYLFINRRQAYVVDVSTLSYEQLCALRSLLYSKVPDKKFKWYN